MPSLLTKSRGRRPKARWWRVRLRLRVRVRARLRDQAEPLLLISKILPNTPPHPPSHQATKTPTHHPTPPTHPPTYPPTSHFSVSSAVYKRSTAEAPVSPLWTVLTSHLVGIRNVSEPLGVDPGVGDTPGFDSRRSAKVRGRVYNVSWPDCPSPSFVSGPSASRLIGARARVYWPEKVVQHSTLMEE